MEPNAKGDKRLAFPPPGTLAMGTEVFSHALLETYLLRRCCLCRLLKLLRREVAVGKERKSVEGQKEEGFFEFTKGQERFVSTEFQ